MKTEIKDLTIVNYDEIIALWKSSEGIGLSRADSREKIDSYLRRNPGMSFVCTVGDRIVGAVLAGHDGRRGYIHHLAVHAGFRRQGIATRLVDRCVKILAGEGIRKCHIFIYNDNEEGIAFWESAGWEYRRDIAVVSKDI